MDSLQDKVAIVTGGTRGIGREIVLSLAKAGAHCVFTYSSSDDIASALEKEIVGMNRRAMAVKLDARSFEGAKLLIDSVKEKFGRLDILVNNAGITRDRSLMSMSEQDWTEVIETNLNGVFNICRAAILTFLKQRSGDIINISSVSGVYPLPGQSNYAAAKAGVIAFTKSLAKEVAPYNVRVNAIAPGFIATDMTAELSEKLREKFIKMIPQQRFGTVEEVAHAVMFLLHSKSKYITGQTLQIDGGLGI